LRLAVDDRARGVHPARRLRRERHRREVVRDGEQRVERE
jgi:hypothetical protein